MAAKMDRRFTMQQYQSILDVYYRDHAGDVTMRKLHQNQLVRLKYLIEGSSTARAGDDANNNK